MNKYSLDDFKVADTLCNDLITIAKHKLANSLADERERIAKIVIREATEKYSQNQHAQEWAKHFATLIRKG